MVFARPPSSSNPSRYQVLGRLAGGGMAEILLGKMITGTGIAKHVVLKRVLAEYGNDPEYLQMFLDEARLCFTLAHPNIAQVYDFTEIDGAYYLAMEYVHGENTHHLLVRSAKNRQPVPLDIAATIVVGAAGGLHHAHTRTTSDRRPLGIVHRDVSPSNIMLSFEGSVKVVDFGVAKATKQQGQRSVHTHVGATKGKVGYMSPEQIRTPGKVDRRSDIFTLGIVMWELLTCKRLYKRATDLETMEATCNHVAPPPSRLRGDVPPAFDAVVACALSKDPEARFATAGDMLVAVEKAAVSAGLVLSTFNLGSFITELFGETPEPWIELSTVNRRDDRDLRTDVHPVVVPLNEATEVEGVAFPSAEPDAASALMPFDVGEPSDPNDERWLPLAQEASVATADIIAAKLTGVNVIVPSPPSRDAEAELATAVEEVAPPTNEVAPAEDAVDVELTVTAHQPDVAASPVYVSAVGAAPTKRSAVSLLAGRSRGTWLAIALLLIVAAGAGVGFALQGGKPAPAKVLAATPATVAEAVAPLAHSDARPAAGPVDAADAVALLDAGAAPAAASPDAAVVTADPITQDPAVAPPFTSAQLLRACAKNAAGNELACAMAACEQQDRKALRRYARSSSVAREINKTTTCARLLKTTDKRAQPKPKSGASLGIDCDKEPLQCQF